MQTRKGMFFFFLILYFILVLAFLLAFQAESMPGMVASAACAMAALVAYAILSRRGRGK